MPTIQAQHFHGTSRELPRQLPSQGTLSYDEPSHSAHGAPFHEALSHATPAVAPLPEPELQLSAPTAEATKPATTAAQWIVGELQRRGVDVVFGIPGGAILPLYDALADSGLRHVLARHEQGAGFMAQGVARVRGKAGVCFATSGPGATNLITALADAQADSVPLVAITAQVPRALLGTNAFQEVKTAELARPVTLLSHMVSCVEELPEWLDRAFEVAQGSRQGPVLLDIPKDVLCGPMPSPNKTADRLDHETSSEMAGAGSSAPAVSETHGAESSAPPTSAPRAIRCAAGTLPRVARWLDASCSASFEYLASRLRTSQRPLLYVGGGVHWANAGAELQQLAETTQTPVVCSLHGLGTLPAEHPLNLGMLGMHGSPQANQATARADFVLAIGARFDDRATGDPSCFCPRATIAHVDRDAREIGKLKATDWGMVDDAAHALCDLLQFSRTQRREAWLEELSRERVEIPHGAAVALLRELNLHLPERLWVTTDVGQHQMWAAQHLAFNRKRRLLTSGGLGTMGFGLPAAIGAALAQPEDTVLCVSGDGSLLMNVQELSLLAELQLDVGILLLNNQQLGMVRQQQQLFYGESYCDCDFPRHDFARIARAFGIAGQSVTLTDGESASDAWQGQLSSFARARGPRLLEVVLAEENVLPMVPPGKPNEQMLLNERAGR